jgi:ubiquinone/menaquinone biosynthesis C-methylase UbiE
MNNKRFNAEIGEEYDLLHHAIPHHDEFQNVVKSLLSTYAEQHASGILRVFEGGCGTGITTERIIAASDRYAVLAVDSEEIMVEQALHKLRDNKRVELACQDMLEALRMQRDSSYDVFASAYTIHNIPPPVRAKIACEIARVLKSDGLFVNADKLARSDRTQYWEDLTEQIMGFTQFITLGKPELTRQWIHHDLTDLDVEFTEDEQLSTLHDMGFRDVRIVYRKGMEAVVSAIRS